MRCLIPSLLSRSAPPQAAPSPPALAVEPLSSQVNVNLCKKSALAPASRVKSLRCLAVCLIQPFRTSSAIPKRVKWIEGNINSPTTRCGSCERRPCISVATQNESKRVRRSPKHDSDLESCAVPEKPYMSWSVALHRRSKSRYF